MKTLSAGKLGKLAFTVANGREACGVYRSRFFWVKMQCARSLDLSNTIGHDDIMFALDSDSGVYAGGHCPCVAGAGGLCHHIGAGIYFLSVSCILFYQPVTGGVPEWGLRAGEVIPIGQVGARGTAERHDEIRQLRRTPITRIGGLHDVLLRQARAVNQTGFNMRGEKQPQRNRHSIYDGTQYCGLHWWPDDFVLPTNHFNSNDTLQRCSGYKRVRDRRDPLTPLSANKRRSTNTGATRTVHSENSIVRRLL
jgi:hypothetical protein